MSATELGANFWRLEMSNKRINDGGPAFQVNAYDGYVRGMSKREVYAMAALAGLSANPETTQTSYKADAVTCVRAADALIAELEKEAHD